jgi:hypothetical protein
MHGPTNVENQKKCSWDRHARISELFFYWRHQYYCDFVYLFSRIKLRFVDSFNPFTR